MLLTICYGWWFQAYNGHNEALHILLGCIMNLDIRDSHGKRLISNDVSNESKVF